MSLRHHPICFFLIEKTGVSIATVSRVINNSPAVIDEVRAKVLEAVNTCGYVPHVSRRTTSFLALVYADSTKSSAQAMDHLITLGYERIAFAFNEHQDGDHGDRFSAYTESLEGAGLSLDPGLIFRVSAHRPDGAQLLRNLMSLPKPPTAIFVTDPPVAVGLINESLNMGMEILRDLSVVGFDDRLPGIMFTPG